jgi:hypothetical protein
MTWLLLLHSGIEASHPAKGGGAVFRGVSLMDRTPHFEAGALRLIAGIRRCFGTAAIVLNL